MAYSETSDSQIQYCNIFAIKHNYFFNQIPSIKGYWKLLPNLKVVTNLK